MREKIWLSPTRMGPKHGEVWRFLYKVSTITDIFPFANKKGFVLMKSGEEAQRWPCWCQQREPHGRSPFKEQPFSQENSRLPHKEINLNARGWIQHLLTFEQVEGISTDTKAGGGGFYYYHGFPTPSSITFHAAVHHFPVIWNGFIWSSKWGSRTEEEGEVSAFRTQPKIFTKCYHFYTVSQ